MANPGSPHASPVNPVGTSSRVGMVRVPPVPRRNTYCTRSAIAAAAVLAHLGRENVALRMERAEQRASATWSELCPRSRPIQWFVWNTNRTHHFSTCGMTAAKTSSREATDSSCSGLECYLGQQQNLQFLEVFRLG